MQQSRDKVQARFFFRDVDCFSKTEVGQVYGKIVNDTTLFI